jgi:hypothetical protein
LYEQPGNGGFIHAPSLNHAVTAAILRNAYLTHHDAEDPGKMAVNLSSGRVRIAQSFLEGIRNGQELGALLGYQFERGLHERYGDPSLNQYILPMRLKYPLVADKITPDDDGDDIDTKESHNVLDGYALVEAVFLRDPPLLTYPYDVTGLPPDPESAHARAIQAEVARMADSLDAVADLALAEGVYQVSQGNHDRAGATLKAIAEGGYPPEPEIARTPRNGTIMTQRVALHLETGVGVSSAWPDTPSQRAMVEPGLNKWLGERLPAPDKIRYAVRRGETNPVMQDLSRLGLQPIDLLYMIGDQPADEGSELESRIAYDNRRAENNDGLEIRIDSEAELSGTDGVTLSELLPLLCGLRQLVTASRPLSADDFTMSAETTTNLDEDANPGGYDFDNLAARVGTAIDAFEAALNALRSAIPPNGADGNPDPALADGELLREALKALADLGVADAFPLSAFGEAEEALRRLVNQANGIQRTADDKLAEAQTLRTEAGDTVRAEEERVTSYREAARKVLGPAFNLIPLFSLKNKIELVAATNFRDAAPDLGLTRHHEDEPRLVDEWLQGVTCVRERIGNLEKIGLLSDVLGLPLPDMRPLQLPYREGDYWVAVEYPEVAAEDTDNPAVFVPRGSFLSIVQLLPAGVFDPEQPQGGLMIDEWNESIPGKRETTGIAVHYDQPGSEPPQTLLLAVPPRVTGSWQWDGLVGTLWDTLARAKQRAVEPDQLGDTPYGHLLPAVLSAVASNPYATIATDLVHQTAIDAVRRHTSNG